MVCFCVKNVASTKYEAWKNPKYAILLSSSMNDKMEKNIESVL
jgi:hypothetical protein